MVDTLNLAKRLRVRSTAYVAGQPVPFFWPMRTFIHHNPLYGLEHLPFAEAVHVGARLFHARVFLPRRDYQRWRADGRIDDATLEAGIARLAAGMPAIDGIAWPDWFRAALRSGQQPLVLPAAEPAAVHAALHGRDAATPDDAERAAARERLFGRVLPPDRPLPECLDAVWGTQLAEAIDELVIRSCLEFFDEEQSSWSMPGRERGLFAAWAELAVRNPRLVRRNPEVRGLLESATDPESAVVEAMERLGIEPERWPAYFTRELTRLHGWAGFIRWRASAKHYHWARRHPADLVDFLAIRLVTGLALLRQAARRHRLPDSRPALDAWLAKHPDRALLGVLLRQDDLLPQWGQRLEDAMARGNDGRCRTLLADYGKDYRKALGRRQADALRALARSAGAEARLDGLDVGAIRDLLAGLADFERAEGLLWTEAMEGRAIDELIAKLHLPRDLPPGKRPFAQAMFCIDVRSEPLRRHLERIGDYQTFGIAGFFGVPVGFLGFGKGSETHLCPAVVTPRNLVLEMPAALDEQDIDFFSTMDHVLHDLKSSVLSPYVTIEAVGMLFGLDLFGRTLAPLGYDRLRSRVASDPQVTRLLLDKLTREHADSIIRALQRAIIAHALYNELRIERERIDDDIIRELRESAMGHQRGAGALSRELGFSTAQEAAFVERLRTVYRINPRYAGYQLERLGRIGFSLDEQANFVRTALATVGLTRTFSRFVLLVGHGSQSQNNPYESALDCGACGGNHGLVSARVLAQMANQTPVRRRLQARGIEIPEDTWFVPAQHNTTTDTIDLHDLDLLPPRLLVYLERLRSGLRAASRLTAAERLPRLLPDEPRMDPARAYRLAHRMAVDWSQVRPEWGLSRNCYAVIGRRALTQGSDLEGRSFLLSYDWRCDPRGRLLENLLTGPGIVGEWINLEHYFSTVDNEHFGSGSKVYHNVAGRFGVMTGNLSDLRTGLPAQTVLRNGRPYHEPMRLIVLVEAPLAFAGRAVQAVVKVKSLVLGQWMRVIVLDPEQGYRPFVFSDGQWVGREPLVGPSATTAEAAA